VQLLHQLGREGGGQLVGHPDGQVPARIGVSEVAELAAALAGQWRDEEACNGGRPRLKSQGGISVRRTANNATFPCLT
jgi:hypothetical protein